MKLKLKKFNALKTISYFYSHRLIFFFQGVNLKAKSWLKIEQSLSQKNLSYFKLKNSIVCLNLKNSIFKNLIPLINSTNFIMTLKPSKSLNVNLNKLVKLDSFFYLTLVKLNNKLYFFDNNLKFPDLNYKKTINSFVFLLVKISKFFIRNLKKFSTI
jgi:hypothetical protein